MKANRPRNISNKKVRSKKNKHPAQEKLHQCRAEWIVTLREGDTQNAELAAKQKRLYLWLFRKDSDWLKHNMPPRSKKVAPL